MSTKIPIPHPDDCGCEYCQNARRTKEKAKARRSCGAAQNQPLRMIRLVLQLRDSPHNREVMDRMEQIARSTEVQGPHSVINREDVQILTLVTARPPQNANNPSAPK